MISSNSFAIALQKDDGGKALLRWLFRRAAPSPKPTSSLATQPDLPDAAPVIDPGEEWMQHMETLSGDAERPDQAPAWALFMRSPFHSWHGATSWLGGVPNAPEGFVWPCGNDGAPLNFLAQIDLAAIRDIPGTGDRVAGLPMSGAVLVFVGLNEYAVRILTESEVADAFPQPVPDDLPPIRNLGHWSDQPTFRKWPVDPAPFIDDGMNKRTIFGNPLSVPASWISTWAIARLESDMVLAEIRGSRRQAIKARRTQLKSGRGGDTAPSQHAAAAKRSQDEYFEMLAASEFRNLRTKLIAWRDMAAKADPAAPVDINALNDLFAARSGLARQMPQYTLKYVLEGRPKALWDKVKRSLPATRDQEQFAATPPGIRPFVEVMTSGWRGHNFFGLAKLDPTINSEDRRGQDLLICVQEDELLQTQMEHEHAISIWCNRQRMAEGDYSVGQLARHSNG